MRRCAAPLLLVALAAPAAAQFVNRATWLGVDEEQIRTDYERGVEYYMDRASYVVLPPWWNRGLPRFEDRAWYTGGSVSSSRLTLEGGIDQRIELGEGFAFRYHLLHSETRDTRILRSAIELEYAIGQESAVFVQSELMAEKSVVDVSVGAWLLRRDANALRVMVTSVDAPSRKGERVIYERDAWAVMLAGAFGDPESHRVAFEIGGQLPFELRDVDAAVDLELHRWIGSVETHIRLGERDWLVGAAEVEWTDKSRRALPGSSLASEEFRRDFHEVRVEWWRDCEDLPWSVGVSHLELDEDGIVAGDPSSNLRGRREEWFGIGRLHVPINEQVSFEPQVLAGNVRRIVRDAARDLYTDRFEGKVALNTRYHFSPDASLAVLVTAQLDEPAFGGGGIQFVARF